MRKQNTRAMEGPSAAVVTIVVTPDVRRWFQETNWVNGHGGFQSLCRFLRDELGAGLILHLTGDDMKRLIHNATAYGDGGPQQMFRKILCMWLAQNSDRLF